MQLEARKYLYDIKSACDLIDQFISGKSLDDYKNDIMLQSAVERQFMVIGEALSQMLRKWPELNSSITNSKQIISFRNVIIHGYSTLETETVWGIICTDLVGLSDEIKTLLD